MSTYPTTHYKPFPGPLGDFTTWGHTTACSPFYDLVNILTQGAISWSWITGQQDAWGNQSFKLYYVNLACKAFKGPLKGF